jgi:hypothetical protein
MPRAKLANVSVEELKKEISRRQKALPKLIAKRDALNCQIAQLENLGAVKPPIAKHGRKPGRKLGRRVTRAPRPGSLRSTLVEALTNKGKLSVAELTAAVQAAGYKSKSKNLPTIVGMTLSQGTKQFRRVRRGVYALKGVSRRGRDR